MRYDTFCKRHIQTDRNWGFQHICLLIVFLSFHISNNIQSLEECFMNTLYILPETNRLLNPEKNSKQNINRRLKRRILKISSQLQVNDHYENVRNMRMFHILGICLLTRGLQGGSELSSFTEECRWILIHRPNSYCHFSNTSAVRAFT